MLLSHQKIGFFLLNERASVSLNEGFCSCNYWTGVRAAVWDWIALCPLFHWLQRTHLMAERSFAVHVKWHKVQSFEERYAYLSSLSFAHLWNHRNGHCSVSVQPWQEFTFPREQRLPLWEGRHVYVIFFFIVARNMRPLKFPVVTGKMWWHVFTNPKQQIWRNLKQAALKSPVITWM